MNGKSQYPVFFKNHAAVTPELVVNRLRRINTYIWLFNKSYSQFVQKTFGNTGQQQDAIRISDSEQIMKLQHIGNTKLLHLFNNLKYLVLCIYINLHCDNPNHQNS